MDLIEHYQPEYVIRFNARNASCDCPACQVASGDWPKTRLTVGNQQRDSLNAACESAAREILLNPEAFLLHTDEAESDSVRDDNAWDETLNQQCINIAVHPALTLESSLYAIGVLLSKAQRYLEENQRDPQRLAVMGNELAQLAQSGILNEQLSLLPPIEINRVEALGEMGAMRLNVNVSGMQKMMLMFKLSELAVMQPARLQDRLRELEMKVIPLLSEQPFIARNVLLYRLYSEHFPCRNASNYGVALKSLTRQFFQLKMLCSLWLEDNETLTVDDFIALFSAWYDWKTQQPQEDDGNNHADYTLLCGLSII
ncbi:hypothetical protein KI694_16985 [Enterobacter oligotrophicus]|uniref:hypothetical protein n=1 Tax=Enterobacter TaxID=547 RepID=UPI001C0360DF|nr:hypothetical protein [Enterobacter oligotrophicus]ELW1648211.1 hypothetical protein [Enterobacter oligotrophicus]MBT9427232.1 hypothetical protein [Enterobacter oligotrophicus]